MIPEQPKPFLKLCQILYQGALDAEGRPTKVFYQEDADGNVIVNEPVFPITFECEVINFVSEDAFKTRGAITAFESVNVTLAAAPGTGTVRQAIYEILKPTYPTLVI